MPLYLHLCLTAFIDVLMDTGICLPNNRLTRYHCRLATAQQHDEYTTVHFHFSIEHRVRAQASPRGISSKSYHFHKERPALFASRTKKEERTTRKQHLLHHENTQHQYLPPGPTPTQNTPPSNNPFSPLYSSLSESSRSTVTKSITMETGNKINLPFQC
jgi:hypothetical protein